MLPVLALLLAACGPATTPGAVAPTAEAPASTATSDPTTATPAPSPTTAPPTPTPLPDRLSLWTSEQGAALDLVRELAAEFSTQSDQNVMIDVLPQHPDNLRVALLAAQATGDPLPDLIWGSEDDLAELLLDGQLQPAAEVFARDDFLPALLESGSRDNTLWGVPLSGQNILLLLYHRGVGAAPPPTTDELIVRSRAFASNDTAGIVAAWNEGRWLLAWLNGFGGWITSPDGTAPTLDTPQMVAALNLWRELRAAAPAEQRDYAGGSEVFRVGQAAYAIDGEWSLPTYQAADAPVEPGIAPMPRVPATDRTAAAIIGGSYLLFPQELADNDVAYARDFAAFLTTPDVQTRMATTLQRLPATLEALDTAAVGSDEWLAAAAAQVKDMRGLPPTRASRCALLAINGGLYDLLSDAPPSLDDVPQQMQQDAEICLDRR
jgi:ABC-type glycerol-3-phosphate transport system substrate-binding protein